ncbi:MAG: MarR family winged helix-turn-helix transcriptional regulator [Pseudomonadota bacterium]
MHPEAAPEQDRILLRTLMRAFCWLDDGLQAHMRVQADFSLPRAQSMIMLCLSEGIQSQAELASRLQVSKQAIRQAIRSMEAKGIVTIERDPANGRQRLVTFTERGEAMRDIARTALARLEDELATRIGRDAVESLHTLLNLDWGPTPDAGERV